LGRGWAIGGVGFVCILLLSREPFRGCGCIVCSGGGRRGRVGKCLCGLLLFMLVLVSELLMARYDIGKIVADMLMTIVNLV
jgi:hypothetical protein